MGTPHGTSRPPQMVRLGGAGRPSAKRKKLVVVDALPKKWAKSIRATQFITTDKGERRD